MRINWLQAKYYYYDGYGCFGTKLMRKANRAGLEIAPMLADTAHEMPGWMQRLAGIDYTRLSLSLMPPHCMPGLPGRQWGYTMTEAAGLPDGWADALNNHVERVIVPCEWLVDVFRNGGVMRPIDVVYGGVDPVEFPLVDKPNYTDQPYTFMSLGDRGTRKGHDLVWRAFCMAFTEKDDVRLVQKQRAYDRTHAPIIDNTASEDNMVRKVAVWAEDVESMADVYTFADCFVFPSRGEGWGMPPREAACMGIPTIVTNWSGLAVGIEHWATRAIENYTLADAPTIPYALKGQWAVADVEEVAAHMRWCYENREVAYAKAREGALWLREHMSWEISAQALIALLERYN